MKMPTFSAIKNEFTAPTSLTNLIILTVTVLKLSHPRFWKILSQNFNSMHVNYKQNLVFFTQKDYHRAY